MSQMSKEELIEVKGKIGKRKLDPRFLDAVAMLDHAINNSRAYADSVNTPEKRAAQKERIEQALESAAHKEGAAYCRAGQRIRY